MTKLKKYFALGFIVGAGMTALGVTVGAIRMQQKAQVCIETALDVLTRHEEEEMADFSRRCSWIIAPLLEAAQPADSTETE